MPYSVYIRGNSGSLTDYGLILRDSGRFFSFSSLVSQHVTGVSGLGGRPHDDAEGGGVLNSITVLNIIHLVQFFNRAALVM